MALTRARARFREEHVDAVVRFREARRLSEGHRVVALSQEVVELLSKGRAGLRNQLERAAISIPLNIAEGAGEYSRGDKSRFYRIARRSATKCAAILEVVSVLNLVADSTKIDWARGSSANRANAHSHGPSLFGVGPGNGNGPGAKSRNMRVTPNSIIDRYVTPGPRGTRVVFGFGQEPL